MLPSSENSLFGKYIQASIREYISPFLIISFENLPPLKSNKESIISDLPAPVSPVKTLNPSSKEILISSIIPIFFICKFVIISHLEQLFTKKLYYMYICLSIHLFLYFTLTLFSLYFIVIIYNL
ncbi:unknown [Clostridium sp. CAG:921]|nr:unknown [Clostridium sp. CAG:921]